MQQLKIGDIAAARKLDRRDVADLARGCAFLGSGGGGDPQTALMEIEAALRKSLEALKVEWKARSDAKREVIALRG